MINIKNLKKSFGEQLLFDDVNLLIADNEKIGLIGRNGSGKSTFLKMLSNTSDSIDGNIEISKGLKIKVLEQNLNFSEKTILDQVCTSLPEGSFGEEWKAKSILMGLGFVLEDFTRSPSEFSSGFQVRIRLAEALVSDSDLLLLDEPTNYLDILSLRWLSRFLKSWKGSFILVSHDSHFMTEVVDYVIGIHRQRMRKMKGSPQKLMNQIKMDEEIYEKTRKNQLKKKEKTDEFIRTFRAGARSAGLVQSRIKSLEKQNIGKKLAKIPEIKFNFRSEIFRASTFLESTNVSFGYEDDKILIKDFSLTINPGDRIAVIGKNGKGKSTLLKLLIGNLKAKSGKISKNTSLKIGYFGSESKNSLNDSVSILEEMISIPNVNEQEVRNLCASLLFTGEAVKKRISTISGGEKSRVCLGKVILSSSNLLILDEPTNHLDMESCKALSDSLKNYNGAVVFVTHNEDMISDLANRLVIFEQGCVFVKNKTYKEFLESGGWAEEDDSSFKFTKKHSSNKQEYLDKKANIQRLRFVRKRQVVLEKNLGRLDSQQEKISEELQVACSNKNYDQIKDLGLKSKEITRIIDDSYQELDDLMNEEIDIVAKGVKL